MKDSQKSVVKLDRSFQNIQHPEIFTAISTEIKKHVEKNQLTTKIKGKLYPHVEAWQFSGALLGLFPRLVELIDLSKERIYKYRATVEIVETASGKVVGSGVAICTNLEQSKKYFDEYAIASMAQTRATGKAFRLCIGWILKASGYEATAIEEMEDQSELNTGKNPSDVFIANEYKMFAMTAIGYCETSKQVSTLAKIARVFHQDPDFIDKVKEIHQGHINAGV